MKVKLVCKPYDYRIFDFQGNQHGGSFTTKVAAETFVERMGFVF